MVFFEEEGAVCLNDGEDVIVFPLKKDELDLLLEVGGEVFSKYINIEYDGEDVWSPEFLKMANAQLDFLDECADFWEWNTVWLIVSAKHKKIVGSLNFKSLPVNGKVEIGYGLNPKYCGQGIMTSALSLVGNWAFENGATCLFANCNKNNVGSIRVLEKNGFEKVVENDQNFVFEKINN